MILASAFIGLIGGLVIGSIAAGAWSAARQVAFESDQYTNWVISASGLLGSILAGGWGRLRLVRLKNEMSGFGKSDEGEIGK